ncbi:RNA-binding protein [Liquorilactobacillus oeni]|uniref:RNA binding protein n=1 Tax=Liquorilactobacillus oeni DSM 19972 TaxID=1423777 RepID=A0A0R1M8V6_9LACO|nr:YlmH/Sll1252 family protein [Liquorilactobacillus oeni]KRL04663.1 RNA binding protein [Liquorilactobacillus oeni DSM 19972]
MVNETIYQHFRPDEGATVSEIADLISQAQSEYRPILSHFLNPRERFIAKTLVNENGQIKMSSEGLVPDAERKRVLFYPAYYQPTLADYELSLFEVKYPIKFASLKHSQILGALMNSGIKRNVLGDIITDGKRWQLIMDAHFGNFLQTQVESVGKIRVRFNLLEPASLVVHRDEWEEIQLTVSSLRVDVLVAAVYHLSRKHAKDILNAELIHMNWMLLDKPDQELAVFDIVSVRGYGRFKLKTVQGISKKGKIRVTVAVLKK